MRSPRRMRASVREQPSSRRRIIELSAFLSPAGTPASSPHQSTAEEVEWRTVSSPDDRHQTRARLVSRQDRVHPALHHRFRLPRRPRTQTAIGAVRAAARSGTPRVEQRQWYIGGNDDRSHDKRKTRIRTIRALEELTTALSCDRERDLEQTLRRPDTRGWSGPTGSRIDRGKVKQTELSRAARRSGANR